MAPPLNFRFNANQQSGSSYPPSLLKRESAGVDCIQRASFITSSMVWLARCKILVPLQLMGKDKEIPTSLYNRLRPSGSLPPRIYGLPKIHKPSTQLRPIVSCIKSPTYQLAKYIASVISPLAGQTDSHVSNSKHFVEMMEDVIVDKGETMVSFDVSSLFTNVPIGEAIDIIRDRLEEDDSLEDRTPLSPHRVAELLQVNLFQF